MVNVLDKERQALDPALKTLLADPQSERKSFVYCANCSHVLAHADDATNVNGQHHHFCTNPHGIDFNVCCYKQALGCAISGQPTGADSWFAGFTWRFASCSACNVHLGWLFEANRIDAQDTSMFYGLVAERIQIDEDRSEP